ncbi:MAG: CBS domain-containing protein [Opitutae bacterium]
MVLQRITIDSILKDKSSSVYFVNDSDTVITAVRVMNEHSIGSVMVASQNRFVGIFTERDVLNRVLSRKLNPDKILLKEVMTKDFLSIEENYTLEETMRLMTQSRVRHLPVFGDSKLIGMVSIGDVTRRLLEINQNEAESLRQYLFSSYSG